MAKKGQSRVTKKAKTKSRKKELAAPKTLPASVKAIVERNATVSPLLKLPGEIREAILKFVIGSQTIHLRENEKYDFDEASWSMDLSGLFHYTLCVATASEDAAYQEFTSGYKDIPIPYTPEYYSVTYAKRHAGCKPPAYRYGYPRSCEPQLDFSILSVCRQLYEEGSQVLWTSNLFSFSSPLVLRCFINSLSTSQSQTLSKIHIHTQWSQLHGCNSLKWDQLTKPSYLKNLSALSGLQTLHATFDQDPLLRGPAELPSDLRPNDLLAVLMERVSKLGVLPWKHVTVVVADDAENCHSGWTILHKRRLAEEIRANLLHGRGAEEDSADAD